MGMPGTGDREEGPEGQGWGTQGLASLGDSGEIGYTLTLSIGETQIHPQVGFEVRMRRIGGREKAQRSSLNLPHHS